MDQERRDSRKKKKIHSEEDQLSLTSLVQGVHGNKSDHSASSLRLDITDDEWLLVFSYLNTPDKVAIAGVCKRWNILSRVSWRASTELCFPQRLWSGTGESSSADDEPRREVLETCLQKCGPRLQCLSLEDTFYNLSPGVLDLVGHYAGLSLQELVLLDTGLTTAALEALGNRLFRLRSLTLRNCEIEEEEHLGLALKKLQSLKYLNFSNDYNALGEFLSHAPLSLTEVTLVQCLRLTDRGVGFLGMNCPDLKVLTMSRCARLTDNGFSFLMRGCRNLENVDIEFSSRLSGLTIISLTKNCPKLKRVHVGELYGITDVLPISTFLLLTKLQHLEEIGLIGLHHVTDEVVDELSRHCSLLRSVSLAGCWNVTNDALAHLSHCPNLESVRLDYCPHIADRGLSLLSAGLGKLKKVYLSHCSNVTGEGVVHLLSTLPSLTVLDVSGCALVTDRVFPALYECLQHRQSIQPLELNLTDTDTSLVPELARLVYFAER